MWHSCGTVMRRRKPKGARKVDQIRIRVTQEQKELISQAAQKAGMDVSPWLRALAVREAQEEYTAKGRNNAR
jgi:uncharacterized protein (DUF1778 family)